MFDYVGEYNGVLAVILYKLGLWQEAISKATIAAENAVVRGSPIALRANRKVIIASLMKTNKDSLAAEITQMTNTDLIGIDFDTEKDLIKNA